MTTDIVIVSAARTAVGSFNGALGGVPAHELGAVAVKAALERAKVASRRSRRGDPRPGADRRARARTRRVRRRSRPAFPTARPPSASIRSAAPACAPWRSPPSRSRRATPRSSSPAARRACRSPPHAAHLRTGTKMGDVKFVDTMIIDGLTDAFNNYHMGITAENVAANGRSPASEQDDFAVASQNKAEAAQKAGKFKDEIVPYVISTRKGDVIVDQDEYIKHGVTLEGVAKLQPGLHQGRHGDRRQRLRPQRRRRGARRDERRRGQEARPDAARPHRLLGDRRRRSVDDGLRPDPGLAQGAGEGRLEGLRSRPRSRPTRPSPRRRSPSTRTSAGIRRSSTSMAARSPSAIRSAPRARAS